MNAPVRPYQGTPAQERMDERRLRLREQAFEAMADNSWHTLSISELCRRAALNKRYFYESFDSLDDLAAAVIDYLSSAVIEQALSTAATGVAEQLDNLELSRKVMRVVLGFLMEDPRRARVLFGNVVDSPSARVSRRQVIDALVAAVSGYGHQHYQSEQQQPLANIAASVLVGGSIEAILRWLDGDIDAGRDQFIDHMAWLWNRVADSVADHLR